MKFFKEHKKIVFLITVILCIALAIITLNYKKPTFIDNLVGYIVSPAQEATTAVSYWISEKIDLISNFNELDKINKELMEENERLKMEASRVEILQKDNERLTNQISLKTRYPSLPMVGAYITATDYVNWNNSFRVNKGSSDGITENMVVVADGGLVGKINKVNVNSSFVIPITDDSSSVGAEIKRSGDFGLVKGSLNISDTAGYCRMVNIDINADILENDEIVTSSLGDIYPPGITIGYVRDISLSSDGLTKEATIAPIVDFKRLDTVFIINQTFESIFANDDEVVDSEEETEKEPVETVSP